MKLLAWCLGHGKSPGWTEYQRGDATCSSPTFPTAKGVRSDQAGLLQSQPVAQLVFTAITVGAGILWVSGTLPPSVLGRSPPDQTDCSRQESLCVPLPRLGILSIHWGTFKALLQNSPFLISIPSLSPVPCAASRLPN